MYSLISLLIMLGIFLLHCGCSKDAGEQSKAIRSFVVQGVVIDIQDEGRTVVIDHEEMPGYMGAMTMPFRVKFPEEVEDLSPGAEIQFIYKVAELSSWVEDIEPTGKKVDLPEGPEFKDQSSKLLKIGDLFPDFELFDEYGKTVELKGYRGSVLTLTFIFTRCPVPEYCPTMMRNFSEADEALKNDPDAPEDYKLLTVSFDSDFDTPDILKTYGEQFKKNSSNWSLAGASNSTTIRSIGEAVGLQFAKSQSAIYSHNLRTVVLDPQGRITKIFMDESWKPEELVAEMKKVAGKK